MSVPEVAGTRRTFSRIAMAGLLAVLGLIAVTAWRGYADPLMPLMLSLAMCF